MKNILNKIAKIERNAEETRLASHHIELAKYKVELGLIDDIKEQSKIISTRKDEAFELLEQTEEKFKTVVDRCGLMESIAEKGIQMAKELGIDAKEFISYKNTAQENAKKFSKYLNLK